LLLDATPGICAVRELDTVRNYGLDGFLPVSAGIVAIAAVLGLVNLNWLQSLGPAQ